MSTFRRHGRVVSLGVGAGALLAGALIPIAAAGAAWADDNDASGDAGGGVNTPIGGGNAGGGAGVEMPNPFLPPPPNAPGGDANLGGGVNTPIGGADVQGGTGVQLPNPFNPVPPEASTGTNVGGDVNTPIGDANVGTDINAGIG